MINSDLESKDHHYSESRNPGGLTVFSDVDNTLMQGSGHDIVYNNALRDAMKKNNISEMYLCTSMSLSDTRTKSEIAHQGDPYETRADIIKRYEDDGIKVKAAYTTPDLMLYAGQQALLNGTFPSLEEMLNTQYHGHSIAERIALSPEMQSQLQSQIQNAYQDFINVMSSDSVMGKYYSEFIAPNYIKAEQTLLRTDPDYQGLHLMSDAFDLYFRSAIETLKEQRGYEEDKTLMIDIIQRESAAKGFPITNYLMFDDAKIITDDVVKAAHPNVGGTAINIKMDQRTAKTHKDACISEAEITTAIKSSYQNMGLQPYNQLSEMLNEKLQEVRQKIEVQNKISKFVQRSLTRRREQRYDALNQLLEDVKSNANNPEQIARICQAATTSRTLSREPWQAFINDLNDISQDFKNLNLSLQEKGTQVLDRHQEQLAQTVQLTSDHDTSEHESISMTASSSIPEPQHIERKETSAEHVEHRASTVSPNYVEFQHDNEPGRVKRMAKKIDNNVKDTENTNQSRKKPGTSH